MKAITKLYCPFCGKEMSADIHAVEDGAKWRNPPGIPKFAFDTEEARKIDNWLCMDCEVAKTTILFVRDDIKEWLE
jgi:hypothetical protein